MTYRIILDIATMAAISLLPVFYSYFDLGSLLEEFFEWWKTPHQN